MFEKIFEQTLTESKQNFGIDSNKLPKEFMDVLVKYNNLINPNFLKQVSNLIHDFDKLDKWKDETPFKSHNNKTVKNYKEINKFDGLKTGLEQIHLIFEHLI